MRSQSSAPPPPPPTHGASCVTVQHDTKQYCNRTFMRAQPLRFLALPPPSRPANPRCYCVGQGSPARLRPERDSVTSQSPLSRKAKSDTRTTRERAGVPDAHDRHRTGCARASATARHTHTVPPTLPPIHPPTHPSPGLSRGLAEQTPLRTAVECGTGRTDTRGPPNCCHRSGSLRHPRQSVLKRWKKASISQTRCGI